MKIGRPGNYENEIRDISLAHHSEISEAFGLDPTEQIHHEIQALRDKFKTTDQKINEVFGLK